MNHKENYFAFYDRLYTPKEFDSFIKYVIQLTNMNLSDEDTNIIKSKAINIYEKYKYVITQKNKYKFNSIFKKPIINVSDKLCKDNFCDHKNNIYELDSLKFIKPKYSESDFITINNHNHLDDIQLTVNQNKFNEIVKNKFEFFNDIDLNNIVICGGFCRSILLNQCVNDFDFFFIGDNPIKDMVRLIKSLVFTIKKGNKNIEFLYCYKNTFNVFELIAFIPNHDSTKNKSLYKFQFIMTKFNSIFSILNNFDMSACRVAWDGKKTYFTKSGYYSYLHMTNFIDLSKNTIAKYRIIKYFLYGFNIGMDKVDFDKLFDKKIYNGKQLIFENKKFSAVCCSRYDTNKTNNYDGKIYQYTSDSKTLTELPNYMGSSYSINMALKILLSNIENNGGTFYRIYKAHDMNNIHDIIKFYKKSGGIFGINKFIPEMFSDDEKLFCDLGNFNIVILKFNDKIVNKHIYTDSYGYTNLDKKLFESGKKMKSFNIKN
jgi:hypothetical protein